MGISTRKLRNVAQHRLAVIDKALVELAGKFGDVDQFVVTRIDEIRADLTEFARDIGSACARLDLPPGEEPED